MKSDSFLQNHPASTNRPSSALLVAALCYLMTQYAREPDAELGAAVRRHLQLLERHPDCNSRIVRRMCQRLSGHWLLLASDRVDSENLSTRPLH